MSGVYMPPSVEVECDKCGTDYGEAFVGQSVWCPRCKRWVLAEEEEAGGD